MMFVLSLLYKLSNKQICMQNICLSASTTPHYIIVFLSLSINFTFIIILIVSERLWIIVKRLSSCVYMQSEIILLRQVDKQKLKSSLLFVRLEALSYLIVFTQKKFYNIFNIPQHTVNLLFVHEVYSPSVFFTHPLSHASVHNSIESSHETVNL